MTNNKLLCCLTIGILFVLILMIGNKVFKNKQIIEENFYDGETTQNQEDLKAQLTAIQDQINNIKTKNVEQDSTLDQKQNKLDDSLESKIKLFENVDLKDLETTNQNIDLYKNALLETDILRKTKDEQQLRSIKENEESVKNMKGSMIQISNTESNLDKIINELGVFHGGYHSQLENILQKRLNINDAVFDVKKKNLDKLVSILSDKIENIQRKTVEEVINQIENVKTATRLVVEKMPATTNIYKIFVNTPENDPGCLYIDMNGIPTGVLCSDVNNQQYTLEKITNEAKYLEKIKKVSDISESVNVSKNIKYPFYLVSPIRNPLTCLVCNIDKGITKLSFRKFDGNMNERFEGFTQIDADLSTCNM
jgi:hypothetical protein